MVSFEEIGTLKELRQVDAYYILNMETTGADPKQDRISRVGMLQVSGGEVVRKAGVTVREDPVDGESTEAQLAENFGRLLPDAVVLAEKKDLAFLKALLENNGQSGQIRTVDLGGMVAALIPSLAGQELARLGFVSATGSFEARFAQLRDLDKALDMEVLVYGRLPLMLTENCILKNRGKGCHCEDAPQTLTDRKGESFPVEKAWGCRNELFNPRILWLADRKSDWSRLGASCARLAFLRESPAKCARIFTAYRTGEGTASEGFTRGLYDRGVE